jgi:hypothetical protein
MKEEPSISRRSLLASGLAVSAGIAGCSGTESSQPSETPRTDSSGTASSRTTEPPAPTLSEFEFPAGASTDGIDGAGLYETHESTITERGSFTLTSDMSVTQPDYDSSRTVTNTFSADGLTRETERSFLVESLWSPSDEDAAYVQLTSDYDGSAYRIDNQAPSRDRIAQLPRFEQVLSGAEWGEPTGVVPAGDGFAATYDSVGIADEQSLYGLVFGDAITAFEASVTVAESGYVHALSLDITVETSDGSRNETMDTTVDSVGDTVVEAPHWAEKARTEGVQFTMTAAADQTAIELEMVNGAAVSPDTRVLFASGREYAEAEISTELTVGDRLYLSFSESGEVLVEEGAVPAGATQLGPEASVAVSWQALLLFEESLRF